MTDLGLMLLSGMKYNGICPPLWTDAVLTSHEIWADKTFMPSLLELCVSGSAGEGDNVADVLHAGNEEQ